MNDDLVKLLREAAMSWRTPDRLVCDRAADRIEKLEEQAHYANGVADLAMKHRDYAEKRVEKLEAALGGAYSWIDRWANHVPNCRAPVRFCTCGRDAVMYELSNSLREKHER